MSSYTAGVVMGCLIGLCIGATGLVFYNLGFFRRELSARWLWLVAACVVLAAVVESA